MPAPTPSRHLLLGAALALLVAGAAHAELAQPPLRWLCWLEDGATTLVCAQDGALIDALFDDPVLQDPAAGARQPDRRAILRAGSVAAALNAQSAAASPTAWRTPLFSPAHDNEFTALLARSVMCGRQPDCRVLFRPAAPLDALGPSAGEARLAASDLGPR